MLSEIEYEYVSVKVQADKDQYFQYRDTDQQLSDNYAVLV